MATSVNDLKCMLMSGETVALGLGFEGLCSAVLLTESAVYLMEHPSVIITGSLSLRNRCYHN